MSIPQDFPELDRCLHEQQLAHYNDPKPSYTERMVHLRALKAWVLAHKEPIINAIHADYGQRSHIETLMFEIYPVLSGMDYVAKHLKSWMRTQRRKIDWMSFFGASNVVSPQPLGVVGIIVPWNFPLFLSCSPLMYVLAAGNRAMIKMSINSSHLARLMAETLPRYFGADTLQVFVDPGGMGRKFSTLAFNHLLFTGSEVTGKSVMAAASKNLCPVTLELGGKSPALICPDFDLETALNRILYVKFANAGQICVTVDHLYVEQTQIDRLVDIAKQTVTGRYRTLHSPDYTAVINHERFLSLQSMLNEARHKGATVIQLNEGPAFDEEKHIIAPHLVLHAPKECRLMREEIFGPILPVIGYTDLASAITAIRQEPGDPLAFYPFTHDKMLASSLIDQIPSGGVSVNDALYHVAQHDMPFGGVGTSGMGHYHGYEGFVTFSKLRPIFRQARFALTRLMWPPYGKFAKNYLKFLTKK